jgi:DNA-binding transcriptional MerR regulator
LPFKEKPTEKRYFTITEVSDMLNVTASLVRFWESEFSFLKPKKNAKGDRRYTLKDIEDLKMVYHYVKEKGYTLAGAREAIKLQGKNPDKKELIESLKELKQFLTELRDNLPE